MPNPKVHVAYSRSRLWVRDVLVAGLLATLCLLLADRVRPPMESPLNRAASGASIAAGKNRSREVVTTAENALRRTGTTALGNTRPVADNAALDQAQHTVANSTSMTGQHLRIHRHRHQHLDRRMGAVLGLFLGDAAAMGLHW